MQDHRLTGRLRQYWEMIRKNEIFPRIEYLNTAAIPDLWPHCFMVCIDDRADTCQYRYEYMGPFITEAFGRDLTGTTISSKTPKQFPGSVAIRKMNEVVSDRRPMEDTGFFLNEAGKLIKYRACCLPFGNAQHLLTHIVTGLTYKEF